MTINKQINVFYVNLPTDAANTKPKPTDNGPAIFKNLSDGAVAATVDKPPTTPAVYHAALITSGPPNNVIGAIKAPKRPACNAQANCFDPNLPCSYGIDLTNLFNSKF